MSSKTSVTGREYGRWAGRGISRLRSGRAAQLIAVAAFMCFSLGVFAHGPAGAWAGGDPAKDYNLPFGPNPFAPGEVRTSTGTFINADQFIPAAYCARCHEDSHEQWLQSAHRNSFREPFYKKNVELFISQQGIELTRHCESCHNPVALVSGALNTGSKLARPFDEEGVTCTVCHSIEKVTSLEGIGSYEIRPPALLVDEQGRPFQDLFDGQGRPVLNAATDQKILDNVGAHRRAMMKDLYRQPEFCAACHKSAMPREIENYKWRRAFSVYDEWQMSSHSKQSPLPFYKKPYNSCQTCHMKPEAATTDVAAKDGRVTSHRWAAANTAIPRFYGYKEQERAVTEFLSGGHLKLDIFTLKKGAAYPTQREATDLISLRKGAAGLGLINGFNNISQIDAPLYRGYMKADEGVIAPLDKSAFTLSAGETVTLGVIISNTGVGHLFPTELRDFFEPWVEFKAEDSRGRVIYHSGFIKPGGEVDERAHIFQSVQVTEQNEAVRKHNIWDTRGKAYDNFIMPGRSELVRYQFTIPKEARGPLRVTARLLYRRFNRHFTDWVLGASVDYPVVQMASASASLNLGENRPAATALDAQDLVRFNNLGIALLEQLMYADARSAFEKTTEIDPKYDDGYVNQALATFWRDPAEMHGLLDRALAVNPENARAIYYKGALLRQAGKPSEALALFNRIEPLYPRDRMILNQMGACLQAMGRHEEARRMFERVLALDPDDITALNLGVEAFRLTGDAARAEAAKASYLDKFEDWRIHYLASEYLKKDEAARAEAVPWHVHSDADIGAATDAVPTYWHADDRKHWHNPGTPKKKP